MVISRKIISQWIDLSKITDSEIETALNNLGLEVEKVIALTKHNTKLIVGQIVSLRKHPTATKLNICDVNLGNETVTIICGAQNIAEHHKVVVAQVGSKLANGMKIELRTIQGVTSHGMICSFSELGLAPNVLNDSEKNGVIILPNDVEVGNQEPLKILELDDTIFVLQLTLNRSDCLAMYSVAKELQIHFNLPWNPMAIADLPKVTNDQKTEIISGQIAALASLQLKLTSDETPITPIVWQRTLQLAGIAPVNFLTDLTNLVMLEVGQPLITFATDHLLIPTIRQAVKDYPEGNFKIFTNDLVLYDNERVFHSLGVSTAEDYQVSLDTKQCFIMSINPDLVSIQSQVKRHGINHNVLINRLTKPIVPDYYLIALQRFIYLLKQLKVTFDLVAFSNDVPYQSALKPITINWQVINEILGTNFEKNLIVDYLQKLGCQVTQNHEQPAIITIISPIHRNDLNQENDFAEEIIRLAGYHTLKSVKPLLLVKEPNQNYQIEQLLTTFRQYLLNFGFNRVKTYSLTSKEQLQNFNYFDYQQPISLQSPISSERSVMRFSLVESLMTICQTNLDHKQTEQLKFFTDDVIYSSDDKTDDHYLTFLLYQQFFSDEITVKGFNQAPFFTMKGLFETFLSKKLNLPITGKLTYQTFTASLLNPNISFKIFYENEQIAVIASTHPAVANPYDFKHPIIFVEVNCSVLHKLVVDTKQKTVQFEKWSKYNSLSRDLSLIISEKVKYGNIKTAVLTTKIPNLVAIKLIDCYLDEQLMSQSLYSITINLQFNSEGEQLDEELINPAIATIKEILITQFKAMIR